MNLISQKNQIVNYSSILMCNNTMNAVIPKFSVYNTILLFSYQISLNDSPCWSTG
jgi:Mg2+ and Co2+ transporter CorA